MIIKHETKYEYTIMQRIVNRKKGGSNVCLLNCHDPKHLSNLPFHLVYCMHQPVLTALQKVVHLLW